MSEPLAAPPASFPAQVPLPPETLPDLQEDVVGAPPSPELQDASPPAEYGSIPLPEIPSDTREYSGDWSMRLVYEFQQEARTLRLSPKQYAWALDGYVHHLLPLFAEHGEFAFERDGLVQAFAMHAKANGLTKTQAIGLWEWLTTHHPEVKRAEVIARMQELACDNGQWKAEYKQLAAQAWALTEKLSKKSR